MVQEVIGHWKGLPVYLTEHARIRMEERGITIGDIREALEKPDMEFINALHN